MDKETAKESALEVSNEAEELPREATTAVPPYRRTAD
jgi:hypothetical protein